MMRKKNITEMEMPLKIGALIREYREKMNFGHDTLAGYAGVGFEELVFIENGHSIFMTLENLEKIFFALRIPVEILDLKKITDQQIRNWTEHQTMDRKQDKLVRLLRDKRKEKGISQAELAILSGVSRRCIITIEKRERKSMTLTKLIPIMECLGIEWSKIDNL